VTGTIWLAYVEEHTLTDPDRRGAGRNRRLRGVPDAVLPEPSDVLDWLAHRRATYRKLADERGMSFNVLLDDRTGANNRLAEAGSSIYATVRQSVTTTVDLCVEAFASQDCLNPRGHRFVKNAKGEWRCTECGQRL
jgi:hypothetical protein